MKRFLFLLIGVSAAAALSSCTKTEMIESDYIPNFSYVYTISENDWNWAEGVTYQVYHDKAIPDLTDYYLLEGNVSVAISFDGEESYDILPATFDGISYSVNYTVGSVRIYAEDPLADPNVAIDLPDNAVVKVILSDAQFVGEL